MIDLISVREPDAYLRERLDAFSASTATSLDFALRYTFEQSYLPAAPPVELLALLTARKSANGHIDLFATVTNKVDELSESWSQGQGCERLARQHQLGWFHLSGPIVLKPVHIPKPWGQEIWHTGMEARGQAMADSDCGAVSLPWLLSLAPRLLLASDLHKLILLKILDPLPEPVFGDLYFELHEEKREVYVITHVDRRSWPNGVGGIRFGFSQNKRRAFENDEAFKRAYVEEVARYRGIREQIDGLLDERREAEGLALNAPVDAKQLALWLESVPEELRAQEQSRRASMDEFIHLRELRVGDVVKVPLRTPHSLMHGVRSIEFQTPVYERKILSFAQKVLTQSHWDTESAMELAELETPTESPLQLLCSDERLRREEVVRFDDFYVERLTLAAGATMELQNTDSYSLVVVVSGSLRLGELELSAEQSALLSLLAAATPIFNPGREESIVLVARPIL